MMAVELNGTGESHARSLITSGKVDKTSAWSMSADDENAILGTDNWTTYASWHLGIDRSATDKTKARYKYPFGKSGKVYRSALTAIRQRAGQQGATSVFDAAGRPLELIDGKAKSAELDCEFRTSRFEYKFAETDANSKGTFEGYASVFNNEDDYGDMMLPGAFKQTLADHDKAGTMPKMLLNHGGMGSFFASPSPEDLLPIGKWSSMTEDSKGLLSKGRLINLDTESGKRIYGAMKENAMDGLSIGFKAKDFTRGTKENEPRRTLKAVDLLEVSPVTFPANTSATVSSVKSAIDFSDLKSAEQLLRDAAGFSRREATAFIARVMSLGQQSDSVTDGEVKQAIAALNRRAILLKG
jgi:HK97 family phage prohead protease